MVSTIIKSHDIDTMAIAWLQGDTKGHGSIILGKMKEKKERKEVLKSLMNLNN